MLGYAKGYLSGWTSDLHCPYCKQYPDFDSATWDLLNRGDHEELVVECSACGKKFVNYPAMNDRACSSKSFWRWRFKVDCDGLVDSSPFVEMFSAPTRSAF